MGPLRAPQAGQSRAGPAGKASAKPARLRPAYGTRTHVKSGLGADVPGPLWAGWVWWTGGWLRGRCGRVGCGGPVEAPLVTPNCSNVLETGAVMVAVAL